MTRHTLLWFCLALWLVAMGGSVVALMAEPTGDSFTRGLNKVSGFISWQLGAAVLAFLTWTLSKPLPEGTRLRWLSRVPGWWCVAMMFAFGGTVAISTLLASSG